MPYLAPRGPHAHQLLGAQVGRNERQAGDPRGNGPAREEEIRAALHEPLQREADPQHEQRVDDDGIVDAAEVQCELSHGLVPEVRVVL